MRGKLIGAAGPGGSKFTIRLGSRKAARTNWTTLSAYAGGAISPNTKVSRVRTELGSGLSCPVGRNGIG